MKITQYIENINQRYKLGNATEHTFRGQLEQLIESVVPGIRATNEPKRQACGAPDYILTKKDIPIGFIEAKNIGDKDLKGKNRSGNKKQFDRYKASLSNLIFTDYINFHLYNDGEFVTKVVLAKVTAKGIVALPENFATFENLIKGFCVYGGQTIENPKKLAKMMAGKAHLLSDVIEKSLTSDADNLEDSTLKEQMMAFKSILIHDITPKGFADVYAQTIAYGMFAARLHDSSLDTFSRQEAAELIPKSNPFLRKLFGYIAGPDIDDRIKWIVDSLTEIFLACDVEGILNNYGKIIKMEDPIIHFYETFLSEYDPKLRKKRGVWYTPAPVVSFIVRAVDDILKTEFDLPQGLADTSKTKIKINTQTPDKKSKTGYKQIEQEAHKVQILDPATGTGTFLVETIKQIHKTFKGQEGIWSDYVENHLLPRLHGFELLMASYAMAHLQVDLLLKETGFKPTTAQRTRVYLTNSLEEHHPDTGTLFATWLSKEADEANYIKRDTPVMCIIGNPPYSGESANKGDWMTKLMEDYKKEPGGKEKLKERNSKWINDDYVKFLRYGQHFIEKNGSGVLAFINPHGFLDNPTFRGMRWRLLKTYDKIYTIDLHGNSYKAETAPDGSKDENVFYIKQGVSINIFVKTGKKKTNKLGKVYHYDLYGKRELKYNFLNNNSLATVPYKLLPNKAPNYFMVQKDFELEENYDKGFIIKELFSKFGVGICSKRDKIAFQENKNEIKDIIRDFNELSEDELKIKFKILKESRDQKISFAKKNINDFGIDDNYYKKVEYRPFDTKWTYYTNMSKGFIAYPVFDVMQHLLNRDNVALITNRQCKTVNYQHSFITNKPNDLHITETANANPYTFPLYLYPVTNDQQTIGETTARKPNLKAEIVKELAKNLDLTFVTEKQDTQDVFAPIDILDYIYAVLHSPTYREKYKEFLKIDFPRVPYPKNKNTFWQLVNLGGELRQIHLLESPKVEQFITIYPKDGNNKITTRIVKTDWEIIDNKGAYPLGRIYINETQYFDNIPLTAWEFYIGGYQPAQKWLKDRKGRTLTYDDIRHYQKIIVALFETDRVMREVDLVGV